MTLKNAIDELPESTRTFFEDTLISIVHCGKYTDYRTQSEDNHCPEFCLKETNLYHRFLEKLKIRKQYIDRQKFDLNLLKVSCMDYRNFMRTLRPNSVNLILTDPPYGDTAQYFEHAQRVHPIMEYSLSSDKERLQKEVVISDAPTRIDKHGKKQFLEDIEQLFIESNRILDDHGFMDVLATNIQGEYELIQCKRYRQGSNIGSTPIQRVYSYMKTRNASRAWVITTSDFTAEGRDEARITNVVLMNGKELLKSLELYYPGRFCL